MLADIWNDTASERYVRAFDRREAYIPFRPADLCLLLVEEMKKKTGEPYSMDDDIDALLEFNRRLTYVMKLTVAQRYDEWQDSYVILDPDVDVVLHESHLEASGDLNRSNETFQWTLRRALEEGSFEKLTEQDLNESVDERSILGLNVELPSRTEIQTIMFARGRRIKTVEIPDWRTLWMKSKEYELKTFQRVVLLLRREEQFENDTCGRWLRLLPFRSESTLSKSVTPGKMYFKIFKDIEASDVDMLIPGSRVQFTRLDFLLLVVPLLLGLISAAWKTINGTMNFDTMAHAMTSAGLVILPLVYTLRAYLAFRTKRNAYQANLVKKLSLQTIANNAGALTAILDEVADQEIMDVLLAYAFMWRGKRVPLVMRRAQMAEEVEDFLNRLLRRHGIETTIEFSAKGACDMLAAMGLFKRYFQSGTDHVVQVVDLKTALQSLSSVDVKRRLKQDSMSSRRTTEYEELNINVL